MFGGGAAGEGGGLAGTRSVELTVTLLIRIEPSQPLRMSLISQVARCEATLQLRVSRASFQMDALINVENLPRAYANPVATTHGLIDDCKQV